MSKACTSCRMWLLSLVVAVCWFGIVRPALAYVEIAYTLGRVVLESTAITVLRVEKVDKERNLIMFRKVQDVKGTMAGETTKHNIGRGGFHEREWKAIMDWAEPGKLAVFFNNGGASETCIGNYWYQAYAGGEWWNMSHGEPYMLRSYAGSPEKLVAIVQSMIAGQEVVVPCMVDGDKQALQLRTAKVQRMKASLKIQDYNAPRDFVGWGGEDFRAVEGMAGFSHIAGVSSVGPDSRGVSVADADGDGKPDFCFYGMGRVSLLKMDGTSLAELPLPYSGGARGAEWADYNADGKPDLMLATPTGPKLLTNLGTSFKDDSQLLPSESYYNVTCAVWLDFDGDKRPDIVLANGFLGLRLYRNTGAGYEDASVAAGLGPEGVGGRVKGDHIAVADINNDGRIDFVYSAGSGLVAMNTPQGFVESRPMAVQFKSGGVRPLFADFDGDGLPELFVPQDGTSRMYANRGGVLTDATAQSGAVSQPMGRAVGATAIDLDGDGKLDLVVGCLKGINRCFRNTGQGQFEDVSDQLGLSLQIFNTRGLAAADINQDGAVDLLLNNEGQESTVLLGRPKVAAVTAR
ncbi:MAG: VCBS repeat-containing protein [Planctomycetes bacterium]|nr:VCBS repeat-containing protein [Planctomycetota bacterium]